MTIRKVAAIAALVVSSLSATAHAELQTWRLTATSYQVQQGFSAPAFAQVGNSFTVDYPTSLDMVSVPEPTSAWLLLAGLPLALWGGARKRAASKE